MGSSGLCYLLFSRTNIHWPATSVLSDGANIGYNIAGNEPVNKAANVGVEPLAVRFMKAVCGEFNPYTPWCESRGKRST